MGDGANEDRIEAAILDESVGDLPNAAILPDQSAQPVPHDCDSRGKHISEGLKQSQPDSLSES